MTMKIDDGVLAVLDRSTFDGNAMALPELLERSLYVQVAKVVEAAGGKWNRKAKAHLFDGDAADAIEPIILTGEVISAKQEFGFFETPPAIVEKIMQRATLKPGMIVLEPSAGRGAIAGAAMKIGVEVHTFERLEPNVEALRRLGLRHVGLGDFLEQDVAPIYHRVLMNPPFAKRADVRHVTYAARFLRHGGKLVAIMSAGVQFRSDRETANFREMVERAGGSIDRLPEDSFKPCGTSVNTVIVEFDR
jgi:predicted RNA methylase